MTHAHSYSRSQSSTFDTVEVLVPLRILRARRRFASELRADLSALIQALPAASSLPLPVDFPVIGTLDEVDPAQFKTWALALIRALPTRTRGGSSWE